MGVYLMKNFRRVFASICLIAVLALSAPIVTFAEDSGPQGGANSTKSPPPPPPPPPPTGGIGTLIGTLLSLLY
jgi:hypothetical protein